MVANPYQEEIRQYLVKQFSLPPQQIDDMLPELIATLAEHIATLESRLNNGDLLELGKAGHAMKGALLNLGLTECADIAQTIELEGKSGNTAVDFQKQVVKLRNKLERYIS